jgi:uncharacterized damage-inducible protein DinB
MTYYGNKELAESARTVRKNTIAVAEDIPEDKYDFRPSPDARSVAELLRHIAVSTHQGVRPRSGLGPGPANLRCTEPNRHPGRRHIAWCGSVARVRVVRR